MFRPPRAKQGMAAVTTSWLFICFLASKEEVVGQRATIFSERHSQIAFSSYRIRYMQDKPDKPELFFSPPKAALLKYLLVLFTTSQQRIMRYTTDNSSVLFNAKICSNTKERLSKSKQKLLVSKHSGQWPQGKMPDVSNLSQRQVRGGRQTKEPDGSLCIS